MWTISSKIQISVETKAEEIFLFDTLFKRLKDSYSDFEFHNNIVKVRSKDFISIFFPLTISWQKLLNSYIFSIQVNVRKLLYTALIILILCSFIIIKSFTLYVWITIPAVIIFIFFQIQSILHPIETIFDEIKEMISNKVLVIQDQEKWLLDSTKCPACGSNLTQYDQTCKECGLFIQHIPVFNRFSLTEDLSQFSINYVITDEEN